MENEFDYIDGEKFEGLADISFGDVYTDEKEMNIEGGGECPLVYCSTDRINELFAKMNGSDKVIDLISHNGDRNFGRSDVINKPKNVRFWYSQNMMYSDEYTYQLPIGLERKFWSKGLHGAFGYKHDHISKIKDVHYEKDKLLYVNFHIRTNVAKRKVNSEFFKKQKYAVIDLGDKTRDYDNYIRNIKESKFVLSPEGHGMDCHRTWETLYLGSIPILERNPYYDNLYSDLPVLLVNDFSAITEGLLHVEYERIVNSKWDMDKLKFSYWGNMIEKKHRE